MRSTFISVLLLSSTLVLAQDSASSDSQFTIQTSPPTPSDSSLLASSTGSGVSNSGSSATGSATSSGSASTATATSPAQFPQVCASNCSAASNALSTCGTGTLNTTCLCTSEIEQSYLECVECALSLNPIPALQRSYQALIDSYIEQCASAEENPVTLSNVTVTLPSTSASSSSGSVSGSSNSASMTSSASRSGGSAVLPSSAVSHAPMSSTSAASASTSAASSGAATSTRGEVKIPFILAGMSFGMMLLGGALVL